MPTVLREQRALSLLQGEADKRRKDGNSGMGPLSLILVSLRLLSVVSFCSVTEVVISMGRVSIYHFLSTGPKQLERCHCASNTLMCLYELHVLYHYVRICLVLYMGMATQSSYLDH